MRQLDKSFVEEVKACATHFKDLSSFDYAAEAYIKLGDTNALVELYIDSQQVNMVTGDVQNLQFMKFRFIWFWSWLLQIKKLLLPIINIYPQWQDAFTLCEEHPQYKEQVFIPYANYLAENDQFDEAQEAYNKAG